MLCACFFKPGWYYSSFFFITARTETAARSAAAANVEPAKPVLGVLSPSSSPPEGFLPLLLSLSPSLSPPEGLLLSSEGLLLSSSGFSSSSEGVDFLASQIVNVFSLYTTPPLFWSTLSLEATVFVVEVICPFSIVNVTELGMISYLLPCASTISLPSAAVSVRVYVPSSSSASSPVPCPLLLSR